MLAFILGWLCSIPISLLIILWLDGYFVNYDDWDDGFGDEEEVELE